MSGVNEYVVETAAKKWFSDLGYMMGYAPTDLEVGLQRESYADVVLWGRLRDAVTKLNSGGNSAMIETVINRIRPVETQDSFGQPSTELLQLVDFEEPG